MEPTNILSVRNLSVEFGSRIVIRGLSFDLNAGDDLAVIGPTGSPAGICPTKSRG
jgi:ABC-type transporter Mla maintaining outer membrane lipid asymmetry ATPase subunit MlaF